MVKSNSCTMSASLFSVLILLVCFSLTKAETCYDIFDGLLSAMPLAEILAMQTDIYTLSSGQSIRCSFVDFGDSIDSTILVSTLFETGSLANLRRDEPLENCAFAGDCSFNELDVAAGETASQYRWSKTAISDYRTQSMEQSVDGVAYLFATCNQNVAMDVDFMLMPFNETILTSYFGAGTCLQITKANIRGYSCENNVGNFWGQSLEHFHFDSAYCLCGTGSCCAWNQGSRASEDNFGFYNAVNPAFSCTSSDAATTDYWISAIVDTAAPTTAAPTTDEPTTAAPTTAAPTTAAPTKGPTVEPTTTPTIEPTLVTTLVTPRRPATNPLLVAVLPPNVPPTRALAEGEVQEEDDEPFVRSIVAVANLSDPFSVLLLAAVVGGSCCLCVGVPTLCCWVRRKKRKHAANAMHTMDEEMDGEHEPGAQRGPGTQHEPGAQHEATGAAVSTAGFAVSPPPPPAAIGHYFAAESRQLPPLPLVCMASSCSVPPPVPADAVKQMYAAEDDDADEDMYLEYPYTKTADTNGQDSTTGGADEVADYTKQSGQPPPATIGHYFAERPQPPPRGPLVGMPSSSSVPPPVPADAFQQAHAAEEEEKWSERVTNGGPGDDVENDAKIGPAADEYEDMYDEDEADDMYKENPCTETTNTNGQGSTTGGSNEVLDYVNKFGQPPQSATLLMNFIRNNTKYGPITFSQARNLMNEYNETGNNEWIIDYRL